jgi:hypothetical protein
VCVFTLVMMQLEVHAVAGWELKHQGVKDYGSSAVKNRSGQTADLIKWKGNAPPKKQSTYSKANEDNDSPEPAPFEVKVRDTDHLRAVPPPAGGPTQVLMQSKDLMLGPRDRSWHPQKEAGVFSVLSSSLLCAFSFFLL